MNAFARCAAWQLTFCIASSSMLLPNAAWGQEGDSTAGTENAPVTLQWNLKPGESLRFEFRQTTNSTTQVEKSVVRLHMEMRASLLWHVNSVDADGNMHLTQTVAGLAMTLRTGDEKDAVVYDSGSAEAPRGTARQIAESVQPLLGLETELTMTPRGEIVQARLTDASAEKVRQLPTSGDLAYLFSAEGIRDTLGQAMPLLPAQPVEEGGTWETQTKLALAVGRLDQKTTLTYRGPETSLKPPLDRIDLTAQLALQPPAEPAGPALQLHDQKTTGSLWFNRTLGRLDHARIEQTLETRTPFRDEWIRVRMTSVLEVELKAEQ